MHAAATTTGAKVQIVLDQFCVSEKDRERLPGDLSRLPYRFASNDLYAHLPMHPSNDTYKLRVTPSFQDSAIEQQGVHVHCPRKHKTCAGGAKSEVGSEYERAVACTLYRLYVYDLQGQL